MAARTNRPNHTDSCRDKIKVSQLLNRLQDHVLGKDDNPEDKPEISATQMKAIEILLRKKLPDLSSVELEATVDGSLTVQIVRLADNPAT